MKSVVTVNKKYPLLSVTPIKNLCKPLGLSGWISYFSELYNQPEPLSQDTDLTTTNLSCENPEKTDIPTIEETKKAVKNLKNGKSPGVCEIPAEALKSLNNASMQRLTDLFGLIWLKRTVPQDFKDAIIVPIYKR